MRILKVIGIGIGAFIGLMVFFFVLDSVVGTENTSRISTNMGNVITIFIAVAVVVVCARYFRKKK